MLQWTAAEKGYDVDPAREAAAFAAEAQGEHARGHA